MISITIKRFVSIIFNKKKNMIRACVGTVQTKGARCAGNQSSFETFSASNGSNLAISATVGANFAFGIIIAVPLNAIKPINID